MFCFVGVAHLSGVTPTFYRQVNVMSNPYKLYATDPNLEKKGIVADFGDFGFRVKRIGGNANPGFAKMHERLMKPYEGLISNGGDIPEQKSIEIFAKCMISEVILDCFVVDGEDENGDRKFKWKTVYDVQGNAVAPNHDVLMAVFKKYPEMLLDLQKQASSRALFAPSDVEDDVKN